MSIATRVIDERHFELNMCLAEIDQPAIRRAFSELMDAAMSVARAHRLDHDDVFFERLIWMRADADHEALAVAGLPLADAAGWLDALIRLRASSGLPAAAESAVRVVQLTLRTLVETDAPLWEGARPDRNLHRK